MFFLLPLPLHVPTMKLTRQTTTVRKVTLVHLPKLTKLSSTDLITRTDGIKDPVELFAGEW